MTLLRFPDFGLKLYQTQYTVVYCSILQYTVVYLVDCSILFLYKHNFCKEKYIQGVINKISDSSKFIPLNIPQDNYINYIVNAEKKIRKLFNNLYDNNKISEDEFLKICPVGSTPGILYGNPKIHKQVVDQFFLLLTLLDIILQNF